MEFIELDPTTALNAGVVLKSHLILNHVKLNNSLIMVLSRLLIGYESDIILSLLAH